MVGRALMICKNRSAILLLFVFLSPLFSPQSAFPKPRLDVPNAEQNVVNAVPFPLIRKIALEKSIEKWGPGALGEPIPMCDLDGNIKAYMFSFHLGADSFPAYPEMLSRIKTGRNLLSHLKHFRVEEAKKIYGELKQHDKNENAEHGSITQYGLADPRLGRVEETRPDGTPSRRLEHAKIKEIEKYAERKGIGAGEYGTIVVSATYDMMPVAAYMHHLAPYYYNYDRALEKAQDLLTENAFLTRIYFLGLKGQYFEFSDTSGRTLLLNSFSLETEDLSELKIPGNTSDQSEPKSNQEKERKAAIKNAIEHQWKNIKYEVGED